MNKLKGYLKVHPLLKNIFINIHEIYNTYRYDLLSNKSLNLYSQIYLGFTQCYETHSGTVDSEKFT